MTTRFDKARDNFLAALDACKLSKLITESEASELQVVIEDCLSSMEDNHPREEHV